VEPPFSFEKPNSDMRWKKKEQKAADPALESLKDPSTDFVSFFFLRAHNPRKTEGQQYR